MTGKDTSDGLVQAVYVNLQHQHDWLRLSLHVNQPRTLIKGMPPHCLYTHPDDQIAALAEERATGTRMAQESEFEWVLPMHLSEKLSIARLAAIFDSVDSLHRRGKRILLAIVHNDSTVAYYYVHEGMVKPRQN